MYELNLTPVSNDETYSRLQDELRPSDDITRRADIDQTQQQERNKPAQKKQQAALAQNHCCRVNHCDSNTSDIDANFDRTVCGNLLQSINIWIKLWAQLDTTSSDSEQTFAQLEFNP